MAAADSALISAAMEHGKTKAGISVPNLTPLYESTVKQGQQFGGMITAAIARRKAEQTISKARRSKLAGGLTKSIESNYKKLYENGDTHPNEEVALIAARVKEIQELYDSVPDDNSVESIRLRAEYEGELKRLFGGATSNTEALGELNTKLNNNLLDENGMDPKTASAAKLILEGFDNPEIRQQQLDSGNLRITLGSNNETIYHIKNYNKRTERVKRTRIIGKNPDGSIITEDVFEDEEVVYGDEISLSFSDMNQSLTGPMSVKGIQTRSIEQLNDAIKEGTDHAEAGGEKDFDEKRSKSKHNASIKTVQELGYMMKNEIEGVGGSTFHEDLLESGELDVNIVKNMFIDDNGDPLPISDEFFAILDDNKDGIIDENDLKGLTPEEAAIWDENSKKLLDVITNTSNKFFNEAISKEMYVSWQTDRERQEYDKAYDKKLKIDNPDAKISPSNTFKMFGQSYPKPEGRPAELELQNMFNITNMVPEVYVNGVEYNWDGENYTDGENVLSRHQLMRRNSKIYFAPESYDFNKTTTQNDAPNLEEETFQKNLAGYASYLNKPK